MSNPEKLSPLARHIIFVQVQIIRKSDLPEDQGAAGIVRDYGVFGSVDFFLEYEARFDTLVDSVKRAAWILHAIAVRHPFQNGNKRTAFVVADAILREEWGFHIGASQKKKGNFLIEVADYQHDVDDVERWIWKYLEKTDEI
ncbi:MAG TPA: Fic family protein [Methanoculleus sp.]|jgi:death-on-curing protein|nr:Fic family protein [Methanoculleus sp.]